MSGSAHELLELRYKIEERFGKNPVGEEMNVKLLCYCYLAQGLTKRVRDVLKIYSEANH